jgi:uncharacterized protein YlzI (FlbEa/FlbD family)
MVNDIDVDNLTLKDIEVMVRILERWIVISRRVEAILSRYSRQYTSMQSNRFSIDYVIDRVMERQQAITDRGMNMGMNMGTDMVDDEDAKKVLEKIRTYRQASKQESST